MVFDITFLESFEEIQFYLRETKLHSDHSEKEKFVRVLFGNKSDIVKEDPSTRQVSEAEIQKKIQEINEENPNNHIIYLEGSAKDKTNIKECFDVFLNFLKEKFMQEYKKPDNNENNGQSFKLDTKKEEDTSKKKKCC